MAGQGGHTDLMSHRFLHTLSSVTLIGECLLTCTVPLTHLTQLIHHRLALAMRTQGMSSMLLNIKTSEYVAVAC